MPQAGEAGGKAGRLAALSRDGDDMGRVLAKQRPSDKITETWALAEAIANGRKS